MISQELLSAVLENDIDFKDCDSFKVIEIVEPNILISYCYPYYDNYDTNGVCDCSFKKSESYINIYELAHKCKEWAYKYHKIIINSRTTSKTKDINGYAEIIKSCDYLYGDYADTEVEAIFKACQWILDNKENK